MVLQVLSCCHISVSGLAVAFRSSSVPKEPIPVSQYHIDAVDPAARNTSHALLLELVGSNARVLDVGCATGFLGEALAAQGCVTTGVEIDPAAAEKARAHLEEVVEADLNVSGLDELFPGREFDVVVFGDVLEHLIDPDAVLRSALPLLVSGGAVVISIPNVTHGSLRLALLQGRWDYRETGLLDRTHLRYFSRKSVIQMVADAGLHITNLWGTVLDPLASDAEIDDESLPGTIVDWVRRQPDALTYQFVLRAEVGRAAATPVPDLVPAAVLPPAEDVHSARAAVAPISPEELIDLRRRMLTLRDYAIGAEASIAAAREEVALARGETQHAREETNVANGHLHRAMMELAEVRQSRTWRTGRILISPLDAVRRGLRRR
jgi:2-polyprenyl-3-methyl-5-hydroxy-6-metoxy-1,4-benzoquinol methylase